MKFTEDTVLCIGRVHGDHDLETLACVSLQIPELALSFGNLAALLEGDENIMVVELPYPLEYDAPSIWIGNSDSGFIPWAEVKEALTAFILPRTRVTFHGLQSKT